MSSWQVLVQLPLERVMLKLWYPDDTLLGLGTQSRNRDWKGTLSGVS